MIYKIATKTVAIYIRVSTAEQAKEGYSLSAQEKILVKFCEQKGYTVYKIYREKGVSAKDTTNRPAFNEMMNEAKNSKFSAVIVWKLSRFSRNLPDLTAVCEELFKRNIYLISYSEKFDCTTPVGRLMLNILGTTAQFEREVIGENVALGLLESAEQGHPHFAQILGYDRIDRNKWIVNEKEAEQVKFIYETFIEKGCVNQVSKICKEKGLVGKRGKKQSQNQIAVILTRPFYAGYVLHKERIYKGNHSAIIDVETFNLVQKMMELQGMKFGKNRKLYFINKSWRREKYGRKTTIP